MKEVNVEKFDHEARGISYVDSKITFIDGTIPGDKVMIEITKSKKNFNEARVVKYINYSTNRIKPVCPYFFKCGGCDLQNISYDYKLEFKENKVREILSKFAKIEINKVKPILSLKDNNFYYRNKLTLQVNNKIGLYSKNSYNLVNIDTCFIVHPKINEIIKKINSTVHLKNVKQIIIRCSFYNNKTMVIFDVNKCDSNFYNEINLLADSVYIKEKGIYNYLSGEKYLEEKIGKYLFKISPDSFFQVNSKMCEKLYDKILEYGNFLGNETVLDLYCGTGTIGIYISKFVKNVIGYEINKYAVSDAFINKKNNMVDNITFYCGDSELSFKNVTQNVDVIIVDPPRAGLSKNVVDSLLSVKVCKIIYVSCDPVTLARDLKLLESVYDVIEITPVDMFPNTKHVECLTLLTLKEDNKDL